MTTLLRVLQDTRNSADLNTCEACGGAVVCNWSDCTNDYSIYIYECKQCGRCYSTILQAFIDE